MNIDNIPIIETHCHADDLGFNRREKLGEDVFDEMLRLQIADNVKYGLFISTEHERIIEHVKKHKERAGAILHVNPQKEGSISALYEHLSKHEGLIKGVKLHPPKDGYKISPFILRELVRIVNAFDIVLASHTSAEDAEALMFLQTLKENPKTKLILYHAFPIKDACMLAREFENVYIDTSYTASNREVQLYALNNMGSERILYGIDSPLGFKLKSTGVYQEGKYRTFARELFAWYKEDIEAIENVLHKNAERLFNL